MNQTPEALFLIVDTLAKGIVLVLLAGLCLFGFRRKSASFRHLFWQATMLGLLALPVLSISLPAWRILPERNAAHASAETSIRPGIIMPFHAVPAVSVKPDRIPGNVTPAAAPQGIPPSGPRVHWLPLVWLTGFMLLLLRLLASHLGVLRLGRKADKVTQGELIEELDRHRERLGLRRRVRLLLSPSRMVPMTWGIFRPTILLPDEATNWSSQQRRAVLLHELAHIRRRDCLWQSLTQLACAIHWPNPLVWLAARRAEAEREQACDDLVLGHGVNAPDYAEVILTISSTFRSPKLLNAGAAASMARPGGLEKRLRDILNQKRNRRSPGAAAVLMIGLCAGLLVVPLAMIQAQAQSQNPDPQAVPETAPESVPDSSRKPASASNQAEIISEINDVLQDIKKREREPSFSTDDLRIRLKCLADQLYQLSSTVDEAAPAVEPEGAPVTDTAPGTIKVRGSDGTVMSADSIDLMVSTGGKGPPSGQGQLYRLSAAQSGIVQNVLFAPGDEVKEGQLLMQLNARQAGAAVTTARERIREVYADLDLQRSQLEDAQRRYERAEPLYKDGTLSMEQHEQLKSETAAASIEVRKAEAALRVAESELNQAEVAVEQYQVYSPVDGTIVSVEAKLGEYVVPGKPAIVLRSSESK